MIGRFQVRVVFQSSAGFDPGRYDRYQTALAAVTGFNPRPGLTPAATEGPAVGLAESVVSILGRV